MERVVIGLIDETADRVSIEWGIERARAREAQVLLVTALDDSASNPGGAQRFLADVAARFESASPGTAVETRLADGRMLPELLQQAESADLLVVAATPDPRLRDGSTPSLPISLAARSPIPAVIVPADWQATPESVAAGPIVVGVEQGGEQSAAVAFAVREAAESGRELRLVHTWESWGALDTKAAHIEHGEVLRATAEWVRSQAPDLRMSVVLEEAVAHVGVLTNSRDASLIVLGTHRIGLNTGVVLGAIHQEVMIAGGVPLCVVPVDAAVAPVADGAT